MATFSEQPPLLPPHCEARPPNPVPPNYQPANSVPYVVKDGDNWGEVARRNGLDARWLIDFNFKTNEYKHVNWYLHNYVGCTRISADKSNFGFSGSDHTAGWSPRAGIIYLPLEMEDDIVTGNQTSQDLLFSAHFQADSLVADAIAVGAGLAEELDLLTTAGKAAGKVLSLGNAVWFITGVLSVRLADVPLSNYAWKFGGFLAAKNVPFTGDGPNYSTHETSIRMNLGVLDPRTAWDRKTVSLTLSWSDFAVKVIRALDEPISGDYRPFPDGMPTLNRDLTIGMKLRQGGPWGLQTTVPGTEPLLIPMGLVTDSAAWQLMQNALNAWRARRP